MSAAQKLREATARPRVVVIAGNPNAGKTTLFNALTGARARTGNYPGVTVERRVGRVALPAIEGHPPETVELVDVPGTYSLASRSAEEQVAVDALMPPSGPGVDVAVIVVDAGTLERHLYLALSILETGLPCVLAVNMMDEARAAGIDIDVEALGRAVGARAVPIVASRGEGIDRLLQAIATAEHERAPARDPLPLSAPLARDVAALEPLVDEVWPGRTDDAATRTAMRRVRALWALLSIGDDELVGIPDALRAKVASLHARAAEEGRSIDREIIEARYARIERIVRDAVRFPEGPRKVTRTERIDAVLTHPALGLAIFFVVMGVLFQALFSWCDPLVSGIEALVAMAQDLARAVLPEGPLSALVADGIVAGVGNVIVFVPQIALLSLFIAVLEDSGYLARVAFVIDRVMAGVGLHGRAFVPLLSGFACAVPAILATRTIESRRDRLITMLALPLMSCSARLPVYTLVIAVAFPASDTLFAGISTGAAALLAMYALSVVATLGAAAVMRRTVLRGPVPVLVLELPPYRAPVLRNVALSVWQRVKTFVVDAGTIILAITIVLWGLLSFPRDAAVDARFDAEIAAAQGSLEGEALDTRVAELEGARGEAQMASSFAGSLGHGLEPIVAPLGFDWRIGIGLVGSFAAREVLVSTLGIVYGVGDDTDETSAPLRERLRAARREDGSVLFTPRTGLSLMVFFVLAAQCMSTLAMLKRESGSWRWPLFALVYMNVLAWVAAFVVYQGAGLLGIP